MEELEAPKLIKSDTNDVTVINRTPFTVGRGLNCDYILAHKIISREHCKFEKIGNQWFLVDTSTNGTFLNDQIVKSGVKPLRDGDVIQLSKDLDFTYTFGISVREEITDEQLCMIADSVLESIEVVTSNEPGPSTSDVRTELKHTLPIESSVDTGVLPEKRIKISTLPPPKDTRLIAGSVIDLTEDPVIDITRVSSGVIDLSDSFQVPPSTSSDLKNVIQNVSVKELPSETGKSDSQQPSTSTSTNKDVKTEEKCEEVKDYDVDEDLICAVCSEMFVKATTLNCSHSFCKSCIETWRTKQSVCPICRSKITSMNPTIVIDNLIDAFVQKSSTSFQEIRKELLDERKELDKNKATNSKSSNHTSAIPNNNHPPAVPQLIYDSDEGEEVTSDSTLDSEEGWDEDDWYNDPRRPYYGGYGRCYVCHRAGHWANSCPFR